MRTLTLTLLLVLFIAPGAFAQDDSTQTEWSGPKFRLQNLDSDTVKESDVFTEGTVYLVDFWASWCRPCQQYLPHLKKIHDEYSERGLVIVIFCIDDAGTVSTAKTALSSGNYPFEILFDTEKKIRDWFGVRMIPTTIMLDETGEELWRHVGYESGNEDEIREQLESLLPEAEE